MMWLLGLFPMYLLVGVVSVKLIQLYDPQEGMDEKNEFFVCIAWWPLVLGKLFFGNLDRLWERFSNCSCFDWFFNLGKKK